MNSQPINNTVIDAVAIFDWRRRMSIPYWLCCGSYDRNSHHRMCIEAKLGHPEHCRFGTALEHSKWQKQPETLDLV